MYAEYIQTHIHTLTHTSGVYTYILCAMHTNTHGAYMYMYVYYVLIHIHEFHMKL